MSKSVNNSIIKPESSGSHIKFEKLSYGTLRRYQTFFKIKDNEYTTNNREKLANLIRDHFADIELNLDKIVEKFSKLEKDQNNEKNNSIRKSLRFQEKNMTKFLDNLSNIK